MQPAIAMTPTGRLKTEEGVPVEPVIDVDTADALRRAFRIQRGGFAALGDERVGSRSSDRFRLLASVCAGVLPTCLPTGRCTY
jgi:hypothetical protein